MKSASAFVKLSLSLSVCIGLPVMGYSSGKSCEDPLKLLAKAREAWKNFQYSDPATAPSEYKYLVHGFNGLYLDPPGAAISKLMIESRTGQSFSTSAEALVESRYRLGIGTLSTSLLTPTLGMWGPLGIILKVAPENIYVAYPGDAEFGTQDPSPLNNLLHYFNKLGLLPPLELIARSPSGTYNEVVVGYGEGLGPPIGVAGIIKTSRSSSYPKFVKELEDYAKKNKLPIIEVE